MTELDQDGTAAAGAAAGGAGDTLGAPRRRRSRSAWWTVLARIHLRGLLAGRGWTVLGAAGVAVGIALLLGVAVLQREVGSPFDALGPQLAENAAGPVTQVGSPVAGHLPEHALGLIEASAPGAVSVPVVADLVELESGPDSAGVLLIGTDCRIEVLVGRFGCDEMLGDQQPAPGPGVPLFLTPAVATDLGVGPGDPLQVAGTRGDVAHVGAILPDASQLTVNDGYLAIAAGVRDAQDLLGRPQFLTDIYVVGDAAPLYAREGALAQQGLEVGAPEGRVPAALATVSQALASTTVAGLVVGILIAINTLVIGIERRRTSLATLAAIGASNGRVLGGLVIEGCVVGAAGGAVAVPLGFLVGRFLVDRFGDSLLSGSGAHVVVPFRPEYVALGVGAGIVCGLVAMAFPGRKLLRGGPIAAMSARGDVHVRRLPWWLAPAGVGAVAIGAAIMYMLGRGSVPVLLGQAGLGWGVLGAVLIAMGLTPLLVHLWARVVGMARAADGTLVAADVDRYPVMTAGTIATLAIGVAMAVAFLVLSQLGATTSSALLEDAMPEGGLVSPQGPWDQRQAFISDDVNAAIADVAGEANVAERWRGVIPSPTQPRIVTGVEPGSWFTDALVAWTETDGDPHRGLEEGGVALSTVAAGRLGAGAGDSVELPTVEGPAQFRVVGVFDPQLSDDTAVGDWVLASDEAARANWGAQRSQVAVRRLTGDMKPRLADAGVGIRVLDAAAWRAAALDGWSRYFQAFVLTGWLIVICAGAATVNMLVIGLSQRRRERAALRAMGMTATVERRVVVWQALALAGLGYVFALVTVYVFTALIWVSSPVYYGFQLRYGTAAGPLLVGLAVSVVIAAVAAVWPLAYTRRLDLPTALRAE